MDGLLLIHAFPLDARMWDVQVADFSDALPVVAPHLPGFGGTAGVGEIMSMRSAAARCLDELDCAGVDRAVVCGLSMGGYVAFELWREARGRIAGIALANTKAGADTPEGAAGRRNLAKRLLSEGNVLVASPPPLLSGEASDDVRDKVERMIADQPPDSIAAASLGMADRPDSTPELASIDVPALVVTSDDDALIPPDVTSPMAGQIPGAELAVIASAGHLSNLEQPEEFNRLLAGLLERSGLSTR